MVGFLPIGVVHHTASSVPKWKNVGIPAFFNDGSVMQLVSVAKYREFSL
jgi:hypothetical protein